MRLGRPSFGWLLLGRLRIRGKFALLAIVPLLAVVALTAPIVVNRVQVANRASDTARAVELAGRVGSIVREVQTERLLAIGKLLGQVADARLGGQAALIADLVSDLRADLGTGLPPSVAASLRNLDKLADIRGKLLTGRATQDDVMASYTAVVTPILDGLRLLQVADAATPAGKQIVALETALRTDEEIARGATYLVMIVAARGTKYVTDALIAQATATYVSARFTENATPEQLAVYTLVQESLAKRTGLNIGTGATIGAASLLTLARLTVERLFAALEAVIKLTQFVERKIVADVLGAVRRQQRDAAFTASGVIGGSLLVLLIVVLLSIAIARAVVVPLTRLTRSADRVAAVTEEELTRVADDEAESTEPVRLERVDVGARDEIGDLSRAFQRVQETAARLVERQVVSRRNVAQMFGHVGRRTQNLVGRQIALIDQLEEAETDPERLQRLYRLDHIASRLRRNAGSLVVLSGSAGADQHMRPLPLTDVVRLALGEIEAYTRVSVDVPTDLTVLPVAISDLVLVLAELMENAATYSPPDTRVAVRAEPTVYGVTVTIADHGVGMTAERLAEENARLARRERLDLEPTEVLGLFVVGRLARRHQLDVTLAATPGGGVTATVQIGRNLLGQAATQPIPAVSGFAIPTTGELPLVVTRAVGRMPLPVERVLPPFSVAALERASQSIESTRPWNAFAVGPRAIEAAPSNGADHTPPPWPPPPSSLPPSPSPSAPTSLAPPSPSPEAEREPSPSASPEAAAEAEAEPRTLRQRVPGTHLPDVPVRATPRPVEPADAAVARALFEDYESGILRAAQAAPAVPAPFAPPPAIPPARSSSRAGSIPFALPRESIAQGPGPALTRRVPGATLNQPIPPPDRPVWQTPSSPSESPEMVRESIEQFELGIARALREAAPAPETEEDTPR